MSNLDTAWITGIRMGVCRVRRRAGQLPVVLAVDTGPKALDLAARAGALPDACRKAGLRGVTVPDGSNPVVLAGAVESACAGGIPDVVAVTGCGVAAVADGPETARLRLKACLEGVAIEPKGTRPLSAGRLAGQVVLVTGGAQGFGKGIAESLIREGAAVVVADLNEAIGVQTADELNRMAGGAVARFVRMDVTSLASLETGVAETVRVFGGLDILVANAGVLKAGSIEELDERAFDLVTAVNYKAYFLCVRAAVPVMKLQRALCPGIWMDVVQINSKSGLEGSNKNFAYAGSKFGGIGLTQSFALELVEYGIKVNSICPGNYYEGPLWSDPEKGLFVQYLRTGKVPGAKTIDDVKAFYMGKVPMRRGCSPLDVTRAILYLHEQEYETGQALPVTGGQVMMN
ncbi:MAG: hypothetical protein A2498_04695 [Lentisphaerae bacterium RIFOXYC12_FULL_60_16]|nr:MAG: hypothetical protein A2498_04695 [Lentisphaerae bacterium RIFOXYC12_FULL_60_16]OGV77942.1 MAG: hypothetical protein A2340_10255 [Lentisphaerae bacterium RIFOXYB12_FULL_60_10]